MNTSQKKIGIFVIGDIGRSPRMVNHAVEFASMPKKRVEIVGLMETELPVQLRKPNIDVLNLPTFYLNWLKKLPSILYLALRIIIEFWILFYILFFKRFNQYEIIFVQNPPAIPLLPVLFLYRLICKTPVHVDVHNFGYTLFQTKNLRLKLIMKALEVFFVRATSSKIYTVSKGMASILRTHWKAKNVEVLYDQPNQRIYKKLSLEEKHKFLLGIPEFRVSDKETILTQANSANSSIERTFNNYLFVVSCSWSPDDNFPLLIDALQRYQASDSSEKRNLIFVFTGTGPLKAYYGNILTNMNLKNVKVYLKWFTTEDYPKIIACADYGVSLHDSTSGFDLPIKILDYFGCQVPAIAYNYSETISELVIPGQNGFLFKNADELKAIFEQVANHKFKSDWNFKSKSWQDEWNSVVRANL